MAPALEEIGRSSRSPCDGASRELVAKGEHFLLQLGDALLLQDADDLALADHLVEVGEVDRDALLRIRGSAQAAGVSRPARAFHRVMICDCRSRSAIVHLDSLVSSL